MASPASFIILAVLAGCATTQAIDKQIGFDDFTPADLVDDYESVSKALDLPSVECAQSLVAGYFVFKSGWDLRKQWLVIQENHTNGLNRCKALPAPEVAACIEAVEKETTAAKSQVYRSGAALTFAGVVAGFKIKGSCFSSTQF